MKYRENASEPWKELYIKALDSMPIGTIVDFDGETSDIPTGWEEVGNDYSTTEIDTGKTWIDGKPVYSKTYVLSNLTGSGRTIDITNLNIDTFLPYEAVGTWSGGGAINWPYYLSNTDNGRIYKVSSTQVNINYAFPDYNGRGLIVTLYYTKTTD